MLQKTISKVTPAHLKKHNESLLLREIYAHESISRVRLAELTHLSRPSVTELTQGLIERGLIMEIGPEFVQDKVGKKPTLLALNPDAFQMIGIVLKDSTVIGFLLDLRMQIHAQQTCTMQNRRGGELVELVIEVIQNTLRQATRPLLGITIGTPGIVNSDSGIIHLTANFDWHNLPLASILSDRFQLPVYIGNDSNLAAIGEYRFGSVQGVRDLVVVEIGEGIGVGILADGRIIQGSTHAAGELGHTPFPTLDDVCVCGRRGCLETIVSLWGIRQHARRIAAENPASLLNQIANGQEITIPMVVQAVEMGDTDVIALLEKAASYLGHALLTVTHLLNPKVIILTGSVVDLGEHFVQHVRRTIHEHTLPHISSQIEVIVNRLDDRSILFGAGAFLLEQELGL